MSKNYHNIILKLKQFFFLKPGFETHLKRSCTHIYIHVLLLNTGLFFFFFFGFSDMNINFRHLSVTCIHTTKVVFISFATCVVCNFHSENLSSLPSCSVNTVWDFIYGREINKKWTIFDWHILTGNMSSLTGRI